MIKNGEKINLKNNTVIWLKSVQKIIVLLKRLEVYFTLKKE
jgi:hypothetical protein